MGKGAEVTAGRRGKEEKRRALFGWGVDPLCSCGNGDGASNQRFFNGLVGDEEGKWE